MDVGSHALIFASAFGPLLHLDDHSEDARYATKLQISLPETVEAFLHARLPGSERIEMCQEGRQAVMHRGWTPIAPGCRPGEGDRVLSLD